MAATTKVPFERSNEPTSWKGVARPDLDDFISKLDAFLTEYRGGKAA